MLILPLCRPTSFIVCVGRALFFSARKCSCGRRLQVAVKNAIAELLLRIFCRSPHWELCAACRELRLDDHPRRTRAFLTIAQGSGRAGATMCWKGELEVHGEKKDLSRNEWRHRFIGGRWPFA